MEIASESEPATTSSALAVEALAAALSAKPANPAAPSRENNLPLLYNVQNQRSTHFAELVALHAGREIESPSEAPSIRSGQAPSEPESVLPQPLTGTKAARAAAVLLPQLADLLNDFSLTNLARVDQSVSAFLSRLDSPQGQSTPDSARGLYPWFLAGVAAAAACAMARWQLRKTPAPQSFDWLTLSANTWNIPHEHKHGRTAR
jgi:hypothetical protein